MAVPVRLVHQAEIDVRKAYRWYRDQSPDATVKWYRQFEKAVSLLADNPVQFRFTPECTDAGHEVREIVFGKRHNTYRILFVTTANEVTVLRVWHASQNDLEVGDIDSE